MEKKILRMRELVSQLNKYRDEYYNGDSQSVSDAVYDRLFDELKALEDEIGIRMTMSPTQTVGYPIVSGLKEVRHEIPLLSLDKTKLIDELVSFQGNKTVNLSPKLDGLTIELVYENGRLIRASTRGDGDVGEEITHNASVISGIPGEIPYKGKLVVSGEAFIHKNDFERLKTNLVDSAGKPYKTCRNLAAGSIRAYDSAVCKERCVCFIPFSVLKGLDDEYPEISDSKRAKTLKIAEFGFNKLKTVQFTENKRELIETCIDMLRKKADEEDLPIDGMVICYDDIAYSKSCGRTGHHFKDGLAYKFEDEKVETILREIEWTPSRTGEITPVAIFDTIEMDGCDVSRASLHNLSFIEELELMPGNRILVSKRNMIIPHVEDNLDRGNFDLAALIPSVCSCCGFPTRIHTTSVTKTLFCDNPDCSTRHLRRFVHFVSKKALDIEGLSEATLERFISKGWLRDFTDIFCLDKYRDEIVALDGFGEKSCQRLWSSIDESRTTSFERFLISMDIPMIGSNASRTLCRVFHGSLDEFEEAVSTGYDFTCLADFGQTLHDNIHNWFKDRTNIKLWKDMKNIMTIKNQNNAVAPNGIFAGLTIVVTGKVEPYTRDEINAKIIALGAKAGNSVTKKTNYLVCGENAGSKLAKARELGVTVITPADFFDMAGE